MKFEQPLRSAQVTVSSLYILKDLHNRISMSCVIAKCEFIHVFGVQAGSCWVHVSLEMGNMQATLLPALLADIQLSDSRKHEL